jgi:ribosomal protein L37AE/L43A
VGWVEVTDTPPLHDCELPRKEEVEARRAGKNSVWQCDVCDQRWTLYNISRGGYVSWSEEHEGNAGSYRIQLNNGQ